MDEELQARWVALGEQFPAAAIPGACKPTASGCLGSLSSPYAHFFQTSESRSIDESTHLIQSRGVNEFTKSGKCSPEPHGCQPDRPASAPPQRARTCRDGQRNGLVVSSPPLLGGRF